jgi:hypothetical protein
VLLISRFEKEEHVLSAENSIDEDANVDPPMFVTVVMPR